VLKHILIFKKVNKKFDNNIIPAFQIFHFTKTDIQVCQGVKLFHAGYVLLKRVNFVLNLLKVILRKF